MTDYTTIQITQAQKEQLDELKRVGGESYRSVVAMLIANYDNNDDGAIDSHNQDTAEAIDSHNADEIAAAVSDRVTSDLLSQLPPKVADELR